MLKSKELFQKGKKHLSPTRQIALSFLVVIFVGSFLLSLPLAQAGETRPYLDHLFVAVSATCVTGLVPFTTCSQYNFFGQIVIILMIQIGGLGFLTFLYILLIRIKKRLTLSHKLVLQEALNQSSLNHLPQFVKRVLKYTLFFEGVGAILLSIQFVKDFGLIKGLYFGIFHAISAFCNAGFDIIGNQSLVPYQNHLFVNLVISGLIIAGGLGFLVWFDLKDKWAKEWRKPALFNKRHYFRSLSLHTKIVLVMTLILLTLGMVSFLVLEYDNVLKGMPFSQKLLVSFFQSVTLRTAGFATIDCFELTTASKLIMAVFMFIGGSPAGTAGGIKTVTFMIIVMMVYRIYQGKRELFIFERRIKKRLVIRSFALFFISLMIVMINLFILTITESLPLENLIFEVFSAFGTVGITASTTPLLSHTGKCVIMILMYIGRIGPITMMISFARQSQLKSNQRIRYPDEDILIG